MYIAIISTSTALSPEICEDDVSYIGSERYLLIDLAIHPTVARLKYNALVDFNNTADLINWLQQDSVYKKVSGFVKLRSEILIELAQERECT